MNSSIENQLKNIKFISVNESNHKISENKIVDNEQELILEKEIKEAAELLVSIIFLKFNGTASFWVQFLLFLFGLFPLIILFFLKANVSCAATLLGRCTDIF